MRKKERIIGIDEAGRGSVVGSMFIAGVQYVEELDRIGVRDSKKLTPKKREYLSARIEELTEYCVLEVTAHEIDILRGNGLTMNDISVLYFSKVFSELQPEKAFVDSSDVNAERFAAKIKENYRKEVEIISEHHADEKYTVVGAASIIAKVYRDRHIRRLESETGMKIGSGYPSDPLTMRFISNIDKYNIPPYVRSSWMTIRRKMEMDI